MILSSDESVGGRALAGDVKVNNLILIVLHSFLGVIDRLLAKLTNK